MKHRNRIIILTALICICQIAMSQGVKFENGLTWDQVKAKALKENKLIFLDIYATWCGPCKEMNQLVYPNEKLGELMNNKFINVQVQMDSTTSDNSQIKQWYKIASDLGREYKIDVFPSFLFFSQQGKIVHKGSGFLEVDQLRQLALDALRPEKQLYTQLAEYESGKLDYSKIPELVKTLSYNGERTKAREIAENYINTHLLALNKDELYTKQNLEFIGNYLEKKGSKSFQIFSTDSKLIDEKLGPNFAEYKMKNAIALHYLPKRSTWISNRPNWDSLERVMQNDFGSLGQEVIYGQRMEYSMKIEDWKAYGKYYRLYFQKALERPDYNANSMSWLLFLNVSDQEELVFGCDTVMKYAIEQWYQSDPACYDTYANLLFKIGRKDDAYQWQIRAAKLLKGTPDEQRYYEKAEKMKMGIPTWTITKSK